MWIKQRAILALSEELLFTGVNGSLPLAQHTLAKLWRSHEHFWLFVIESSLEWGNLNVFFYLLLCLFTAKFRLLRWKCLHQASKKFISKMNHLKWVSWHSHFLWVWCNVSTGLLCLKLKAVNDLPGSVFVNNLMEICNCFKFGELVWSHLSVLHVSYIFVHVCICLRTSNS